MGVPRSLLAGTDHGDGTTNPAYTVYVWQSGMVAHGVAGIARELAALGDARAADVIAYASALVRRWDTARTTRSKSHPCDSALGGAAAEEEVTYPVDEA